MSKFNKFGDWLDAVSDTELELRDIIATNTAYEFYVSGSLMAYWDREMDFGYISEELLCN